MNGNYVGQSFFKVNGVLNWLTIMKLIGTCMAPGVVALAVSNLTEQLIGVLSCQVSQHAPHPQYRTPTF